MEQIVVELISIIPSLLWFLLFIFFVVLFYKPIRNDLLPNLSSFSAMGVEFSFIKDSIDAAVELAEKSPQWNVTVSPHDKERALNRAKKHLKLFREARLLWVDDHPEGNRNERRMFRQLMTHVESARSTEEALELVKSQEFDLVISDMERGSDTRAGLDFLKKLRDKDEETPVIFYIGVMAPDKGVPPQAFGITNRPDELLHLTLDVLERKRS